MGERDSDQDINTYGPIALTDVFGKILEKSLSQGLRRPFPELRPSAPRVVHGLYHCKIIGILDAKAVVGCKGGQSPPFLSL